MKGTRQTNTVITNFRKPNTSSLENRTGAYPSSWKKERKKEKKKERDEETK